MRATSSNCDATKPVRRRLLRRRRCREMIRVLVLRMPVMPTHPSPLHLVSLHGIHRRVPELEILDRSALPRPAATRPVANPRLHAVHEVARVAREHDAELLALSRQQSKASRSPSEAPCGCSSSPGSDTQRSRRTISVDSGRMYSIKRARTAWVVCPLDRCRGTTRRRRRRRADASCRSADRRHFTTSIDCTSSTKNVITLPLGMPRLNRFAATLDREARWNDDVLGTASHHGDSRLSR